MTFAKQRRCFQALGVSATQWRYQLGFALAWALAISTGILLHFLFRGWTVNSQLVTVTAFYFCGAFAGGYLALLMAVAGTQKRPQTARFALFFLLLSALTLACTIALFALQHRMYFSQWHDDFGTLTWFYQLFFTGLGSVFLFLLSGLRPLLPFGVILLLLASYCFSRGCLSTSR